MITSGEPAESRDSPRPAASHCVPPAAGSALGIRQRGEEEVVEGKGFVGHASNNRALLARTIVQNAAECGIPRNQAQPTLASTCAPDVLAPPSWRALNRSLRSDLRHAIAMREDDAREAHRPEQQGPRLRPRHGPAPAH